MRNAIDHPDLPATRVDGSMMEPAEQNSVVGVRRPAAGMLLDVMDLAPLRRDVAAGNEASTVPQVIARRWWWLKTRSMVSIDTIRPFAPVTTRCTAPVHAM